MTVTRMGMGMLCNLKPEGTFLVSLLSTIGPYG